MQDIHDQCISQMKTALSALNNFQKGVNYSEYIHNTLTQNYDRYVQDAKGNEDYVIPDLSDQGLEYVGCICNLSGGERVNDEVANALKELWKEPAIKKMYELRNVITGIEDSILYFWNKLDVIKQTDYIPDEMDCLFEHTRTSG